MGQTLINLDSQTEGRVVTLGTTGAGNEALLTLNKGTQAASYVTLTTPGSVTIGGDLNLTGKLIITGSIDEQSVTNLAVNDINITLNKGGTTAGAAGSGLFIEGDSAAVIGKLLYDGTLQSKWKIGDGSTQLEVVTVSSTQTLTNKTIGGGQITGNISGNAANVTGTVAVANGGTGVATLTAGIVVANGAANFATVAAPTGTVVGTTDTQTLSAKTLTTPKIAQINDATNNLSTLLLLSPVSGVNQITINGNIAGQAPSIQATGTDSVINLNLVSKSTGIVTINGVAAVDISTVQTLTNKIIGGSQISGNISGNAANVTGVVLPANGGTGLNTYTAFALLTGGTTSTGNFQQVTSLGTSGWVLTSNGAGALPTFQAISSSTYFRSTTVSGTQDGSNKVFTIGNALSSGSEQVFINGQLQTPGSSNDYLISGTTITFQAARPAPTATAVIRVYGNY